MLGAKLSNKLMDLVASILPAGMASSVVRALGLKIPTTPAALAASILVMTDKVLRGIEESIADTEKKGVIVRGPDTDPEQVAAEIACAFFWMSLSILSEDKFASDGILHCLYTAKVLEELERLAFEKIIYTVSLEALSAETSDLYFRDRPTLNELARQMPSHILEVEIKEVEKMENWTVTFILKAKTRIFRALDTKAGSFGGVPIGVHFQIAMVEAIKLFRKLRPVLVDPSGLSPSAQDIYASARSLDSPAADAHKLKARRGA